MERGLDPMTTNLVVADISRTEKTICLAVSPALKAYGIPGRARLFEVVERVKEVNAERRREESAIVTKAAGDTEKAISQIEDTVTGSSNAFSGIVGAIAQTGITKLVGDVALDAR